MPALLNPRGFEAPTREPAGEASIRSCPVVRSHLRLAAFSLRVCLTQTKMAGSSTFRKECGEARMTNKKPFRSAS